MKVVIPYVESRYSLGATAAHRLLLGFSKSGYGAFSMLLRHPDFFGKAFAWDSPVAMSDPRSGWDYLKILGSTANFANYRIPTLLQQRAALLANGNARLFLSGYSYDFTRRDHARLGEQMRALQIPHGYTLGTYRRHVWNSGWVPDAVATLLG